VKKVASVALAAAVLAATASACDSSHGESTLADGLRGLCTLFWTYPSAHGIPVYSSYDAAHKALTTEYARQYQHDGPGLFPYAAGLMPRMKVTARSTVRVATIEVAFYDGWGDETNHRVTFAVHKTLEPGQSYSTDDYNTAADVVSLSVPETGDTNVASCAVVNWTPADHN
jgi:hypothetical protein